MKFTRNILTFAAALAAALLPHVSLADTVSITLNAPVQTVSTTGGTLSFAGTVKNTSSVTEYFSGDSLGSFSLDPAYYTFDDQGFYNNLFQLDPGQSYAGALFTLTLTGNLPTGNFVGSYVINASPNSDLSGDSRAGSAFFQANVTAPSTAVTPEPSSLLLLGSGLVGAVGVLRRRLAA